MKSIASLLVLLILAGACKRREEPVATSTAPPSRGATATATAAPPTATGTETGAIMPEYTAMWLDGSKFDIQSRRGKVVLLNIWATWCAPCRAEIPELKQIHDKYAAKGFEVIGVSVDESGVDPVKQFVEQQQMQYPVVIDPAGNIANIFQTSMLPTSVLLDRQGRILWQRSTIILPNDEELAQAIEKAIGS